MRRPVKVSKGVKYGVVAGVIYGIVSLPTSYYSFEVMWPSVEAVLRQQGLAEEAIEAAYTMASISSIAGPLIFSIIMPGIVFGIIGAILWGKIGRSWLAKGLALGVIVFAVEAGISFISSAFYRVPTLPEEVLESLALLGLTTSIVASLAYGIAFSILARGATE